MHFKLSNDVEVRPVLLPAFCLVTKQQNLYFYR